VPADPHLSERRILAESWRLLRGNQARLFALAAAIELPLVVVEVTLHVAPGVRSLLQWDALAPVVAIVLLYGSLSHYFFAGVLERFVTADRLRAPAPTLGQVVRDLPWFHLLVADVVLTVAIAAGLLLFIVPGILVATWFALTLPLINLEDLRPMAAFRRSASLVQGHAWTVGGITVATFVAPELFLGVTAAASDGFETLASLFIQAAVATLLLPIAALPLVVTTYDLLEAQGATVSRPSAPSCELKDDAPGRAG